VSGDLTVLDRFKLQGSLLRSTHYLIKSNQKTDVDDRKTGVVALYPEMRADFAE
jgi:hypothetical protein